MIHTLMAQSGISLQVNPITTRPNLKVFRSFEGPKWAHFTRWCTPNGLG